jgi:hypothetical protein
MLCVVMRIILIGIFAVRLSVFMVHVVMLSVVLLIIVMHLQSVFIVMLTVFMVSVVVLKVVAPPSPRTDTPTLQPQVGSTFSAKKKFFRMSQKGKKISATC